LLRDHLTALHMAFVEAAEERAGATTPETTPGETGKAESKQAGPVAAGDSEAQPSGGDSRKKFTKKY
jgi:hypothetical protein